MRSKEEIEAFIRELAPYADVSAASAAARLSPSSAFAECAPLGLATAKLARWLAVLRRDYGDSAFQEAVSQLAGQRAAAPPVLEEPVNKVRVRRLLSLVRDADPALALLVFLTLFFGKKMNGLPDKFSRLAELFPEAKGDELLSTLLAAAALRQGDPGAVDSAEEKRKAACFRFIEALGVKAGVGHELEFSEKAELAELLAKSGVDMHRLEPYLRSREEGGAGSGVRRGGLEELGRAVPQERALGFDWMILKALDGSLMVRGDEIGRKHGRGRSVVFLLDKSGSMARFFDEAKAAVLRLLLSRRVGSLTLCLFDDTPVFYDMKREFGRGLKALLTVKAGGGTDISKALREAAKKHPGSDLILITDGEDKVSEDAAEGGNLITFFVGGGENESLKRISREWFTADEFSAERVSRLVEAEKRGAGLKR